MSDFETIEEYVVVRIRTALSTDGDEFLTISGYLGGILNIGILTVTEKKSSVRRLYSIISNSFK